MNPFNPARRAGQVQRDDAPYIPIAQRDLESELGLRLVIQELRAELSQARKDYKMEKAARADLIHRWPENDEEAASKLRAIGVYAAGLRTWYRDNEQAQQIATDILFMIEKVGKK